MCLREALWHLGWEILGRVLQRFPGEAVQVLEDTGFLQRTPLWYYILADAAVLQDGQRLGPVGSTIVAEVLVGLVRHSEHSILRAENWGPNLPRETPNTFTLTDLLRFAGVL